MKIGVFDSGKGGEAVAAELKRLLPEAQVISINDSKNVPYGARSRAEIIKLTNAAIMPLLAMGCDTIVIACNTATAAAIQVLRATYPTQKFVGLEPMIKPAAQITRSGVVAVLATPVTLGSHRYYELKREWAADLTVIEPDCSSWAELIEHNRADEIPLAKTIQELTSSNVDVIVLACTHYHWLKADIEKIAGPNVTVLEPSEAIKNRLVDIIR